MIFTTWMTLNVAGYWKDLGCPKSGRSDGSHWGGMSSSTDTTQSHWTRAYHWMEQTLLIRSWTKSCLCSNSSRWTTIGLSFCKRKMKPTNWSGCRPFVLPKRSATKRTSQSHAFCSDLLPKATSINLDGKKRWIIYSLAALSPYAGCCKDIVEWLTLYLTWDHVLVVGQGV